tara:strand:- start:16541 stop:16927 length:387 start_codon:yes stop_codon:yes gene_type:complete
MYQKLTIIGRLTRDADVKDINGSTVANFSIAASESWKNKQTGEREQRTEYFDCQCWIPGVTKYLSTPAGRKGNTLVVTGAFRSRERTDVTLSNGKPYKVWELHVDAVQVVHSKDRDSEPSSDSTAGFA